MTELFILTAVPPKKEDDELTSFCGNKKFLGEYECWISTETRGDLFTCTLHVNSHSREDKICCIRGMDVLQDLDRVRSREFRDEIELKSHETKDVVLFYERVVSGCCPVCVVVTVADQTPRSLGCFDFLSPNKNASVCLVLGNTKLYVHREYLAFCSPVFKAMFSCYFAEGKGTEVKLNNVNPDYFIIYLNILYHNNRLITEESCPHLLDLADQFDTSCVKLLCQSYLIMNLPYTKDWLELLKLCKRYNLDHVMNRIHMSKIRSLIGVESKEQKFLANLLESNLQLDDGKKRKATGDLFAALNYHIDLTKPTKNLQEVAFVINGLKIYGDKKMLSIFSPKFRRMFESTNKDEPVAIKDVKYQEFYHVISMLLHSVYEKQRLYEYIVLPVLSLAKKYEIEVIVEECHLFLLTYDGNHEPFNKLLVVAEVYKFEDLKEVLLRRIAQITSALTGLITTNCFDSMPVCSFTVEESHSFLRKYFM